MRGAVVAVVGIVAILIGAGAGCLVGVHGVQSSSARPSSTTSQSITTSFTTTGFLNGGNVQDNGSTIIKGDYMGYTLFVVYPNTSQSGNLNAPTRTATVTLDCNNSSFAINADNRVIVSLHITGSGNTVYMDGSRLELVIIGNLNRVTVAPQPVMLYGEQVNGSGNQLYVTTLPY